MPPKNTVLGLNFEKKHTRWLVTYKRPCNIILSANAHEKVLKSYSPSTKLNFVYKNYRCFFLSFNGESSGLSSPSFKHYYFYIYYFEPTLFSFYLFKIYISTGFFNFLKSLFFSASS